MRSPRPILQLRIELLDIQPLIWRRVQVSAEHMVGGRPTLPGAPGYAHLLQVRSDPHDEEHDEMAAWLARSKRLRGGFDPEAFDAQAVRFARPGPRLARLLASFPATGD